MAPSDICKDPSAMVFLIISIACGVLMITPYDFIVSERMCMISDSNLVLGPETGKTVQICNRYFPCFQSENMTVLILKTSLR